MKKIAVILSVVILSIALFSVPAYADSATIALSKSNVTVGTNVTVTVTYNASFGMYAIDGTLNYNSSVLQYVSGGTNNGSSVKVVEALSGEKTTRATIKFKAISAGAGSLSFTGKASGNGDGTASAGATVTVTAVQPSSNANLSSITLSSGTLSPEFSANKTEYTAAVDYEIEKISIDAKAAAGDSKVEGNGTFDLKIGDNKRAITVTAASGAKKAYNITIKRMTEEETAAAREEARKNNPYLIVVNELDYFIKADLSELGSIAGYTLSSVERKGASIAVFTDEKGKYTLYWATDENGENGSFFTSNEQDEFNRINYFRLGDKLYIIEQFDTDISVNSAFTPEKYEIGGESVDCYKYSDETIADFYVFNCYTNGKNEYYRYDELESTLQREPAFISTEPVLSANNTEGILAKFNSLNTQAKIVLMLLAVAALLVIVLIILLIIKAAKSEPVSDDGEDISDIDFASVIPDDSLITENTVLDETEDVLSKEETESDIDNSEFLDTDD